jgi:glycosyltransferase involved in cell wall biosynthesis
MKIAYLSSAFSIHTVRWVNEMARRDYEIHLITMHSPDSNKPIDNRVSLHKLPFSPPLGYFLNKWHLKKLLRQITPALLHTHYASGYGTLSRSSGFHPTLLSVWGSDVFVFPHEAKWKEKLLCKNLSAADYIASTSHAMKEQIEKFVNPKHPITVTPFGVDSEKFKPFKRPINPNEFIVGTIKTLEKEYGISTLIKAFAIVRQKYYGSKKVRLVIAGRGSLESYLKKLAKDLGVDKETEFLGYVPHSAVPNILNRFSVSVSVSDSESFGVAVVEASSCGIPVIVSDAGGLPEVVKNNITGFIVPRKNAEATAEAIIRLVEDVELRERMGREGRNFVLQNYEWRENASRMEKLYGKIV